MQVPHLPITCQNPSKGKAKRVTDAIKKFGGEAIAVTGDVTDPSFAERLVKETIRYNSIFNSLTFSAFGKLNIIVNNAGYTWDGMLHKMTDKQWEAMLAYVNYYSNILTL
jgi:3-oxoacyl-[acyl-carrier protein] reductase